MASPNARSVYRIVYPERERPQLLLPTGTVHVLDCSEAGLRYLDPTGRTPTLGTVVAGRVRFATGDEIDVRGRVVRIGEQDVALKLDAPGIPFARIFDEQRRLRTYLATEGG